MNNSTIKLMLVTNREGEIDRSESPADDFGSDTMFSQVEDRGNLLLLLLLGTFKGGEIREKETPYSLCMNVCFYWENRLTGWISVSELKCHGALLVWTSYVSRAATWVSFF